MNINEAITNRANKVLKLEKGQLLIQPNDHVNLGQSSNDVFPSVMHITVLEQLKN